MVSRSSEVTGALTATPFFKKFFNDLFLSKVIIAPVLLLERVKTAVSTFLYKSSLSKIFSTPKFPDLVLIVLNGLAIKEFKSPIFAVATMIKIIALTPMMVMKAYSKSSKKETKAKTKEMERTTKGTVLLIVLIKAKSKRP